jgi:hypothetical protein
VRNLWIHGIIEPDLAERSGDWSRNQSGHVNGCGRGLLADASSLNLDREKGLIHAMTPGIHDRDEMPCRAAVLILEIHHPTSVAAGRPAPADAWRSIEKRLHGLVQRLADHYEESCLSRLDDLADECTWPLDDIPFGLIPKQVLCWYLYDRIDPVTKRTPLRTFADREVSDPVLREHLLKMEHPSWGKYLVLGVKNGLLEIEDRTTGARLLAWTTPSTLGLARPGWTVRAAVQPWGPHWRLNGIVTFTESEDAALARLGIMPSNMMNSFRQGLERDWVAKVDKMILRDSSTLQSVLNKYPAPWIDGICKSLGSRPRGRKEGKVKLILSELAPSSLGNVVSSLPKESREALSLLLERGGSANLGALQKRFSTDVGWWWDEEPPSSPFGVLRSCGLVIVGRMAGPGGKLYRVAMVPKELREPLAELIENAVR